MAIMPESNSKPNILIIHADQHRWDCIGAYGNPDIRTPNIDGLARDGVLYENSFCPYPVCTPSRYSLLTGLYVHQHLGWNNHCTLPSGIPTFPRILRSSGYRTKAVGKMHFTPTYVDVGFDDMVLAEQHGPGRFYDDYHRWLRDEVVYDAIDLFDQREEYRENAPAEYWEVLGALTSDLDEAHHSTTWIADRAVEALDGWDEGGNLLMAGFIKPHHPFDPPAPWDSMYEPDTLSLLPGWLEEPLGRDLAYSEGYFPHRGHTEDKIRRVMALYYATISQIDHHVGRLFASLKRRRLYDDTLIVYTGDHGDYMGFHHLLLKGNYMYDPLVRVPLIIKYPARAGGGKVDDRLVNNIDLAPTLLRVAGEEAPATMGGIDLADESAGREVVFAEGYGGREYMARTRTEKLLLCNESAQSQYFDLSADSLELENRIDDPACSGGVEELRDALLQWALFDSPSRVHLNYKAPEISAENVSPQGGESATAVADYFRSRMSDTQK